ncbi:MAG: helix-turn-helix transcriptional regulator [Candidatus Margulisbacteria bacterium]|jgi:transcriptional regulator with XRE-family HTH domain|nr:helix-turn-helix transcriptional regulator [Candidatus Margulisiibacteriota bacterium]
MKTAFDKFINNNPQERELFDREYRNFVLSEFVLEKMEQKNLSVRAMAKKSGVSPTVIQKIRGKNAENINYKTFSSVLYTLGYQFTVVPLKQSVLSPKQRKKLVKNFTAP